jgi:hypothetical protein
VDISSNLKQSHYGIPKSLGNHSSFSDYDNSRDPRASIMYLHLTEYMIRWGVINEELPLIGKDRGPIFCLEFQRALIEFKNL